ncbi:hypothetical protein EVAR_22064_1 [Eumeta japonica]|uniref:Uncharacterized protein n=1 Tax=Eumeta variegata TaxID=151549 RepID=A0A4C1UTX9_EUMVA|nr:hypothetical protein EVAR_22064_1 [Eumeta japonica]
MTYHVTRTLDVSPASTRLQLVRSPEGRPALVTRPPPIGNDSMRGTAAIDYVGNTIDHALAGKTIRRYEKQYPGCILNRGLIMRLTASL